MRLIALVAAAAFLTLPATAPAKAHHAKGGLHASDAYAAVSKKKKVKKTKAKKEEYLRAVPSR